MFPTSAVLLLNLRKEGHKVIFRRRGFGCQDIAFDGLAKLLAHDLIFFWRLYPDLDPVPGHLGDFDLDIADHDRFAGFSGENKHFSVPPDCRQGAAGWGSLLQGWFAARIWSGGLR